MFQTSFQKAQEYISQKDWDKAREILLPALYEEPDDKEALSLLGILYTESGEQEKALKALEYCLRLGSNSIDTLEALGCCHLRLKQYPEAEQYLSRAVGLEPSSPSLWRNIAILYSQLGKAAECRQALIRSNELDPRDYLTLYALASMYLYYGELESAQQVLHELIAVHAPEDLINFAKDALQKLGNLTRPKSI